MKIKKVCESETYKYFLEERGPYQKNYWERDASYETAQETLVEIRHILAFLRQNLQRAANRTENTQPIEVDLDYIYDIGAEQDFYCALTGEELEFTRGGQYWLGKWCNPNSCTIDRIDSDKGYIEGNIQLITWKANCLKQHLNNSEFIEFCKDVARYNK
jgi:hypothetical protein